MKGERESLQKRFLTIKEASEYLNLSTYFLYKLTAQKSIPHTRIGRKILFDVKKLERFIDENSFEIQDWDEKARELNR